MKRIASGAAALLVIAAWALGFSWSSTAASHLGAPTHQDFPPKYGTPVKIIVLPTSPPTHNRDTLSPSQQRSALHIALSDPRVRKLIQGKPYFVKRTLIWQTSNGKLVGGIARIGFTHPVTIAGEWLSSGGKLYRATYRKVLALRVYVDLNRARVMAIKPRTAHK